MYKSNIGKQDIRLHNTLSLYKNNSYLWVRGKLGILKLKIFPMLKMNIRQNKLKLIPISLFNGSSWGVYRCMVSNMISGISSGYYNTLELFGLGFRATLIQNRLHLKIGYSHDVSKQIPSSITIKVIGNTQMYFKGLNLQSINSYIERIYKLKIPDPYKGKGVRNPNISLTLKEGKKKK